MKLRQMALVGSLLFVLIGCGNDSPIVDPVPNPTPNPTPSPNPIPSPTPVAGTISGTVTAPAGGSLTGTVARACLISDIQDNELCDAPVDAQVGSTGTYTISNLQASPYAVGAFADTDGSGTITNGEYLGIYGTTTSFTPVTPPATDINITLQVFDGGTPTPSPSNLTGTWTGTTTTTSFGTQQTAFELADSSGSVSGTLTLTGGQGQFEADNPVTGTVSGSSVSLSAGYESTSDPTATVEFTYSGTFTGLTMAGTVALSFSDGTTDSGQFSATQGGASTTPFDKALVNSLFRNIR